MALKFTAESFLNLVRQSKLVEEVRLEQLLADMDAAGVDVSNSQEISDGLVAAKALTGWQAEKLLRGKHKGFFLGKYRLQSLLGKGGMSSVYLADHVLMRRRCAIKVLPHNRVADSSYLERFHREAQAVAALDHPNIVRAYDVDREVDGTAVIHFLVMEFVEGSSLQELVTAEGPTECRTAADYIRQAALGLSHAHDAGLVHRDIKPGNLLVNMEGIVKILDLGLARFFEEDEEDPITLRHDEKVLGTADYLAPEQALDSHQVDARADIYSLGCTFYYLLTGHPPFTEGTLAQRLMWHQTKTPPPIAGERSDVPATLIEVVETMMSKSPDDRYQSADAVATRLEDWLGGRPPTPHSPPIAHPVGQEPPGSSPPVARPVSAPATPPVAEAVTPLVSPIGGPASADPLPVSDDNDLADFLTNLGEPSSPAAAPAPAPPTLPALPTASPSPAPAPPPVTVATPANTTAEPTVADAAPVIPPAPPETAAVEASTFPVLETEIVPETAPGSGTSSRTSRRRSGLPTRAIALGVGVVLLIGVVSWAVFAFVSSGDGGDGGDGGQDPSPKPAGGKKSDAGAAAVRPAAGKPKPVLEVGPESEFKTIAAALGYVREHSDRYNSATRRLNVTIKVLGDQSYAESIVIDGKQHQWPPGIAIVATGLGPATLAPAGKDPVIRLNQVEYVRIEGFHLKAAGRPAAIVLAGAQDRVELKEITAEGFSQAGLRAEGAAGDPSTDMLKLHDLTLVAGAADAVALLFTNGEFDTANIDVRGCRLIGPMAAGIRFDDDVSSLAIRETMMLGARDGIVFAGAGRSWKRLSIRNNTFFQSTRGLVFEQMPTENSGDVTFQRNLFVEQLGPECLVENGYDDLKFSQMLSTSAAVDGNYSSRTTLPDKKRGERELMLPGPKVQRGVEVKFSSTDPATDDFFEPRLGSRLPLGRGSDPERPRFVGARPVGR